MKRLILSIGFLCCALGFAQREYHVFPEQHNITPGTAKGDGSLGQPWDLQTALNQTYNTINGGDIVWIHEGIYNGRFISHLQSTIPDRHIRVAPFKNGKVVINGNVNSNKTSVLEVRGRQVMFMDFEITFLGYFSRRQTEPNFQKVDGINHSNGVGCKFINLVIHNNPGSGIGSWRRTADSEINGCFVFNNGYYSTKRGSGVGIYVQNSDHKFKLIRNNVIFNNYYKGIEVWSDNRNAKEAYVKNIILENNVIFNSALVTGIPRDNLIIATNDNASVNIARHIKVLNNILYHNTNYAKNEIDGEMPSLTLGFNPKAPIEDITITGNTILGRNDGIRIMYAKGLTFRDNTVYSGFIRFHKSFYGNFNVKSWDFSGNTFYTRKPKTIRIQSSEDFTIEEWQKQYGLGKDSKWKPISEFDLGPVLSITQNDYNPNRYRVVLFSKNEEDITVDFNRYGLSKNLKYTIRDVENHSTVLKSGVLGKDKSITFPMKLNKGNPNKSLDNFGVFVLEFSER